MGRKDTMVQVPARASERFLNPHDTSDDLEMVLERSRLAGVKSMIITGGSLFESKEALQLAKTYGSLCARNPTQAVTDRLYHRVLCDYRVSSNTVWPV